MERFPAEMDPRELLEHLEHNHDVRWPWDPDGESFERFLVRTAEAHLEWHHEAPNHDHEHAWPPARCCPVCGGLGNVPAMSMTGDPLVLPCPECAGLAILPASVDDDELAS